MIISVWNLVAFLAVSIFGFEMPTIDLFGSDDPNVQMAAPVVLVELFTGELIKKFRFTGKWLSQIPKEDSYVNNNVIRMVDVGADPNVLINNNTYPIAANQRPDEDIAVSLFKYDTTNTRITDDELYASSYDKIASVVEQHKVVLEERIAEHGLHSLCPISNTADTPVILTTGAVVNGRRQMLLADIANLKLRLDNLKVPNAPGERMLILCNDHVNDLIMDSDAKNTFRDRYVNTKTGEPIDFLGFTIMQETYCPVFNAALTKKAFGTVATPATDRNASTLILKSRAFRAKGTLKMYYTPSELNPTTRETVAGFRLYNVVLHKKAVGSGAIISGV